MKYMDKRRVRICSNCGSTEIGTSGGDAGAYNYCLVCGFSRNVSPGADNQAPIVEIPASKVKAFRRKIIELRSRRNLRQTQ